MKRAFVMVACGVGVIGTAAGIAAVNKTFGPGIHRVGHGDVPPGTYRSRGGSTCYWERLKNFSGQLGGIAANDNAIGPAVVTIAPTDKGFNSHGCATWTSNLARITKSKTRFADGTYIVRVDIAPGTYRARGGEACYWERLRNFSGELGGIIANGNVTGLAIVTISAGDRGFSSHGCGTWSRF
jgi:hypothetical protein